MSNAIDRLDKSTKSAVENAFVKAGIPRSDAKTFNLYCIFSYLDIELTCPKIL